MAIMEGKLELGYESFLLLLFLFIYFVAYRKIRKVVNGVLARVLALMLVYLCFSLELIKVFPTKDPGLRLLTHVSPISLLIR